MSGPANYQLIEAKHGRFLVPPNDAYVGRSLVKYGQFSEPEVTLFQQLITKEMRVLEVGGNLGALTVPLAALAGELVVFEPQRWVYQLLVANVALNGHFNVRPYWMGVGQRQRTLLIPVLDPNAPNNFGGFEIDQGFDRGDPVQVMPLDELKGMDCSFLKADCEGMELDVLKGAQKLIARCRPILYLEADRPAKRAALADWLRAHQYTCFQFNPPLYDPDNYRQDPENVFANIVSLNVLCVPAERKMNIEGLAPMNWESA